MVVGTAGAKRHRGIAWGYWDDYQRKESSARKEQTPFRIDGQVIDSLFAAAFYVTLSTHQGENIPGDARIPLGAIEMAKEFWGWPDQYERSVSPRGRRRQGDVAEQRGVGSPWVSGFRPPIEPGAGSAPQRRQGPVREGARIGTHLLTGGSKENVALQRGHESDVEGGARCPVLKTKRP